MESESESEFDDSTDSEEDYDLSDEHTTYLTTASGLNNDVVLDLWKSQRGLCRVSDLPMSFTNGFYRATIRPRIVSKAVSDTNAIMVCEVVANMQQITGLPWKSFVALLKSIAKDVF